MISHMVYVRDWHTFFCRGSDSKYFRLRESFMDSLCCFFLPSPTLHSTSLFLQKCKYHFKLTSDTKIEHRLDLAFAPYFADLWSTSIYHVYLARIDVL